jgi:RHS repeat-associated protein
VLVRDLRHLSKFAYDGLARTTQVTGPEGRVTETSYDKLSRVTSVAEDKNGKNRTTTYAYDQYDETEEAYFDKITADNGGETVYFYADPKDAVRVTKVVYPDDGEVAITYDNNGAVATRQDPRDWKTTFTRDALGRVTQETVTQEGATAITGTKNVRYTYDALSRLTKVEDDNGQTDGGSPDYDFAVVEYVYDWEDTGTDQTVDEKQSFNGSSARTVTSTITADGVRSELEFPNGRTISFTHDDLHRLTAVTESSTTIADYAYKGLYVQDRKLNNDALRLTFKDSTDLDGYDAWGRITWMRHYDTSGPTDVVKLGYAYNYASSPGYQEDLWSGSGNKDEWFDYDTLHRLTHFKRGTLNAGKTDITGTPAREQEWDSLDDLGNWASIISKTSGANSTPYEDRTHNSANEITAITPQGGSQYNVSHDAAGNLSQDGTNATTSRKFVYDFRNRLINVKKLDDTVIATYHHDGLNRRVHRKVENSGSLNEERVYLYDNWQVAEELKADGGNWPTDRQYVYGGRYIDEVLVMDVNTDPGSDNDCTDGGGSKRYLFCENNNWNVLALTDETGTVKERYEYDPYGAVTVAVDDSSGNPYRFQGRRYDPEHGMYYFRNRTLYPALGRFVQRDPIGYADGMNLYSAYFVPAHSDPMGLGWGWFGRGAKAVWTAAKWVARKPGQAVDLVGAGIGYVGKGAGYIPAVGDPLESALGTLGHATQAVGNLAQFEFSQAGQHALEAGKGVLVTPVQALQTMWESPQTAAGLAIGAANLVTCPLTGWAKVYYITCCSGGNIRRSVLVIEGGLFQEVTQAGVSFGKVILIPKGTGFTATGGASWLLKHECGHSHAQSAVLGPLYLPTVIMGAYVPASMYEYVAGFGNVRLRWPYFLVDIPMAIVSIPQAIARGIRYNWIESWATRAGQQLNPQKR